MSTATSRTLNGADAAAALERRRAADRDRNARYRARQRTLLEQARAPAAPAAPRSEDSERRPAGAPPTHETRPLGELGQSPEAFLRAAPAVDHVEPAEPIDPDGAKKFAALVALVFRVALDDAIPRYDLSRFTVELGAELDASELLAAKSGAVRFVYEHAERCALKHGLGISLPWEDELVTLGAGGGSLLYLVAKFTGRLDRRSDRDTSPVPAAARVAGAPPRAADDGPDSDFGPLRVESERDEP